MTKTYDDLYQKLCEKSNFPSEMLRFSNEKFGTKYDPYDILKKDFTQCVARFSDNEILEIVEKSFGNKLNDYQKQSLAHSIWTVMSDRSLAALVQIVTKTIGEEGCFAADYEPTGDVASPKI